MATDKVAVVRKGFEAFANGDLDTLGQLFTDDIVWHSPPGDTVISGEYKGRDEVFGLFGKVFEETGGSFSQEIHDITSSDEHVVAMVNATAGRRGKTLEIGQFVVFHFAGDKVSEVFLFTTDHEQAQEFWAP
jgi:hypothetical protein